MKPTLPDVDAQAVSNNLWSSAKLGLNPDAVVPGMTNALAAKLLQRIMDGVRSQPNAQSCANFLWALTSLRHELADKGLVDAFCDHFCMLTKHHHDSKQPCAQDCANMLWALATLDHEPVERAW